MAICDDYSLTLLSCLRSFSSVLAPVITFTLISAYTCWNYHILAVWYCVIAFIRETQTISYRRAKNIWILKYLWFNAWTLRLIINSLWNYVQWATTSIYIFGDTFCWFEIGLTTISCIFWLTQTLLESWTLWSAKRLNTLIKIFWKKIERIKKIQTKMHCLSIAWV